MTPQEPSDVPMSATDPRFWLRLALGLLVIAAVLTALAVMGWLAVCLMSDHWALDVWITPRGIVGLIGGGLVFGLPTLMALLFVGAIAFFIGDAILGKGKMKEANRTEGREVRS